MATIREFTLLISPQELLDTSLAQLQTLTAFLHDHLPADHQRAGSAGVEVRVCEDIMRSLDELIARSARSQL
jgi:hypothetical protein